ncbi:alpha-L-fucosidase [Mucilaginibacter pineti]|uniref:alpha-L-fucosidase n=1 Tax=Mucilaginibacter pineti TaxID=1391627 RepID=A0A1G7E1Q3_9SPHI|nr:alpha-L-fucosidase [Mucilaginibacter pineti]SDE57552.1 alpha-L-fucosidase [Mucilaginibacter pineti]
MNKKYLAQAFMLGLLTTACAGTAQAGSLKDSVATKSRVHAVVETSRTAWWEKARFGMFIHWGVYTIPAGVYDGKEYPGLGEWLMHDAKIPVATYKDYAKKFNPTEYNPEQWVKMAKAAGMKYIVITTKHHDGFALFDSKASDWNVVKATPYGKDLIKPLAEACRKQGMKLGFYYSQANDWNNKGGAAADGHWDKAQDGSFDDYIDKVAIPQVREILTNYGDVAELWWDVPTDMTKERAAKFLPVVALQPNIITNDRLGGDDKGDLFTPEQYIPATGIKGLWETCMTMNNTWGFKTNDHDWKSGKSLIRNLIETASKGGNYLLNVGPEPTGKFPAPIVERLAEIGKWMDVNSESIYGTTASPFKYLPWGRATEKAEANGNTTLYLQVYTWPTDGKLLIPGLDNTILSAKFLANGKALTTGKANDQLFVNVPTAALDETSTVIKLTIKGKPQIKEFVQNPEADGSIVLHPELADLHAKKGSHSMSAEGGNNQNLGFWTDPTSSASWKIMVNKPGTYTVETWVAMAGPSTKIALSSGNETIKKEVTSTGDYGNYKKVELGTITLSKTGLTTISLTGEEADWNPVNVRKIVLKP